MERHPSPFWEHSALLYAVSTRDVTPSTHGFFFLNYLQRFVSQDNGSVEMPEPVRELVDHIYGAPDVLLPGNPHTARVTAFHQHRSVIKDSMGVCDWVFPALRRNSAIATAVSSKASRSFVSSPAKPIIK